MFPVEDKTDYTYIYEDSYYTGYGEDKYDYGYGNDYYYGYDDYYYGDFDYTYSGYTYEYDYDYDYTPQYENINLYLLPEGQTPEDYSDLVKMEIFGKELYVDGIITGMLYSDDIVCNITGEMDSDYIIKGFYIKDCNVDVSEYGWDYAKVAKYDDTKEPLSIYGPLDTILVFYEEWEFYGKESDYDYDMPKGDYYTVYLLPKG